MSSFLFSSYLLHFNCKFVVQKKGAWMGTQYRSCWLDSTNCTRPNLHLIYIILGTQPFLCKSVFLTPVLRSYVQMCNLNDDLKWSV